MPKIVNLLLLVGGMIMAGFGLAASRVSPVLFGLGLIVLAFFSDRRRERRVNEKRSSDIAGRIAELTRAPWHSRQTLQIHRSPWTAVGLMLGGFASAWAIHKGITSVPVVWKLVLGGSLFLALAAVALARSLAGPGKPACELDRNGFVTPFHGPIPWREVSGIYLQQFTHRGTTTSILFFRVERFRHIAADIHWSERLFALFGLGALRRGVIGVQLKGSEEDPETVHAVARFLWKQATGLDHQWNPMLSDDYNEAAKRVSEIASRRPDPDVLTEPDVALNEALAELEQVKKDFATMRTEDARVSSRFNWAIGIAVIVTLLSVAWPWLSRP
jgi:hypothetical protein